MLLINMLLFDWQEMRSEKAKRIDWLLTREDNLWARKRLDRRLILPVNQDIDLCEREEFSRRRNSFLWRPASHKYSHASYASRHDVDKAMAGFVFLARKKLTVSSLWIGVRQPSDIEPRHIPREREKGEKKHNGLCNDRWMVNIFLQESASNSSAPEKWDDPSIIIQCP